MHFWRLAFPCSPHCARQSLIISMCELVELCAKRVPSSCRLAVFFVGCCLFHYFARNVGHSRRTDLLLFCLGRWPAGWVWVLWATWVLVRVAGLSVAQWANERRRVRACRTLVRFCYPELSRCSQSGIQFSDEKQTYSWYEYI